MTPAGPRALAIRRAIALTLGAMLAIAALSACGSAGKKTIAPGTAAVVSAPVRTVHTTLGTVGYRVIGTGPPLVLIMGYDSTMEIWDPRLIHALSQHHRVVMFDNAGIGRTQPRPAPLTIDAMASQTSALITALKLGKTDVLGWSMGGMIAQALAVLHPAQVRRLVLCATYPGTHTTLPSSRNIEAGNIFPADQRAAAAAFKAAISEYPAAAAPPAQVKEGQADAVTAWWGGTDLAGRRTTTIAVPTLVADGTEDELDPVANDHALARLIRRAQLVLYPDAGHGFLFQDAARFVARADSFLTGPAR
jgi:pimeloyl-ACP methyl ester carboxylesterase